MKASGAVRCLISGGIPPERIEGAGAYLRDSIKQRNVVAASAAFEGPISVLESVGMTADRILHEILAEVSRVRSATSAR